MTIAITGADGRVHTLAADPERTLIQAAALSGLWSLGALCSGLGRCGRCRVRFPDDAPAPVPGEDAVLSPEELAEGWRLGCRHRAVSGTGVLLPAPPSPEVAAGPAPSGQPLALAVDLGTTSIHWQALREDGAEAASGSFLNPQLGAGSEVMSRLALARGGEGPRLRNLVLGALQAVLAGLPGAVTRISVAGNPAMTNLLLGLPVDGLATAPYRLDYVGGREEPLPGDLPPAYIPPQLAPFVGGDLSAGLTALALGAAGQAPKPPFLLADMGTNGEFLLALPDGAVLAASVPLGPALEGIGLRFGNVAGPGVATSFSMQTASREPGKPFAPALVPQYSLGGDPSPGSGMTGTAYLDLVRHLFDLGILDAEGRFRTPDMGPGIFLARGLRERGGERVFDLPGGMYLSGADVEEILKVKAAFNLALSRLLREAGLPAEGLTALFLAGAMGAHVSGSDLTVLGFIPTGLSRRVRAVGNTSLAGARLLLTDPAARALAEGLPSRTRLVDLTGDPAFGQEFVGRMRFSFVP